MDSHANLIYCAGIPLTATSESLVHVSTLADGKVPAVYELTLWGTGIDIYRQLGSWTANVGLEGTTLTASATVVLQ